MRDTVIRKLGSLTLILIFALCNTPTSALHTLFANHHDQKAQQNGQATQISSPGIDCHCNSNVVTAPFLPQPNNIAVADVERCAVYISAPVVHLVSADPFHTALRGPPQVD